MRPRRPFDPEGARAMLPALSAWALAPFALATFALLSMLGPEGDLIGAARIADRLVGAARAQDGSSMIRPCCSFVAVGSLASGLTV